MGMNKSLDVYIISIEGRDAEENAMFYPPTPTPQKTFDQSNSLGKWAKCLCDPLAGNN